MPRMLQGEAGSMMTGKVGAFVYSGIRPNKLTATEYTLVRIGVDRSSSVSGFEPMINDGLKTVLKACKHSPRAENLLISLVTFGSDVKEEHGFLPLSSIDPDNYQPFSAGGSTKLRDAFYSSVVAVNGYAKTLFDNNYAVNGLTIILTDGEDVGSSMGVGDIKKELQRVKKTEEIESHLTILIGFNAAQCQQSLQDLQTGAGIDKYIDAGNLTVSSMAKLADFISKSISAQSSSFGTGTASQPLTI